MHCVVELNGRYRSVRLFDNDVLILRNIGDSGSDLVNGCNVIALCPLPTRIPSVSGAVSAPSDEVFRKELHHFRMYGHRVYGAHPYTDSRSLRVSW